MKIEENIAKLKEEVKKNYSPSKCGWTSERSCGNYDDCFEDGTQSGASWVWYEVGQILGMDLPKPEEPDYE